jgi:flagellar operon protein
MPESLKINPALRELEVRQTTPQADRRTSNTNAPAAPSDFSELLRAKQGIAPPQTKPSDALKFSAHAQTRIQSRHIALDSARMERLQTAVQKAAGKGAKDALVLMDELAMVVSVTNKTVVTVVDRDNLKNNVFTNIDSAVIA